MSYVIGVCLMLFGSVGQNLGQNLIALGHKEKELVKKDVNVTEIIETIQRYSNVSSHENNVTPDKEIVVDEISKEAVNENIYEIFGLKISGKYIRTFGVIIFVCGALSTFGAFGFGSQSLLASLESVQFVSNIVFAKVVNKEEITYKVIIATFLIIIGNILVVIFASKEELTYNSKEIGELYKTNTSYHIYLIIVGLFWLLCLYLFYKYYNYRLKNNKKLYKHDIIEPATFIITTTIVGTQAVLQSKSLAMLIKVSGEGENEFDKAGVYIILIAWLAMVSFFLRRMDWALLLYPPVFIIPVLQVFFILFAIICGGIFFEEFLTYNGSQWTGFVFGVLLICVGVYGLAPQDIDIIANIGRRNSLRICGPDISKLINNETVRSSITRKSIVTIDHVNPMINATISFTTKYPFSSQSNKKNNNDDNNDDSNDNDDYYEKNNSTSSTNDINIEMNSFPFAPGRNANNNIES